MWYRAAKDLQKRYKNKIFHGGLRDNYDSISNIGIFPQIGDWVSEAYGPDIDEEEFDNENNEDSYWANWEELAKAFGAMEHHIGKKLNFDYLDQITPEHIQQHGLLAITKPTSDFYRMPEGGMDYPRQYDEDKMGFVGPRYYNEDNYGQGTDSQPFGVESGDVFTKEPVGPDKVYVGKKLKRLYNKFIQHNQNLKQRHEMMEKRNKELKQRQEEIRRKQEFEKNQLKFDFPQ
jgi:hypothetical protein